MRETGSDTPGVTEVLPRHAPEDRTDEQGSGLIDVTVALGFLAIVLTNVFSVLIAHISLDAANRETALATAAAQEILERMEGSPFTQVYALFNANPLDDPPGVTNVPGNLVTVAGLSSQGAPAVGQIIFPTDPSTGFALREDLFMPELGMPLDLNADGVIDAQDRSQDYVVLPVIIRLSWVGTSGPRSFEIHTLLGN